MSDGPFFPLERVGQFAWILASSDGNEYIAGGRIIPSSAEKQGSYHTQLRWQTGIAILVSNLILPTTQNN